jgi:CBS domain-containing protein
MATKNVLDERVAGTQGETPCHPRVRPLTVNSILPDKLPQLHPIRADATAIEAVKQMADQSIGAVPVLDGDCLIGIFTESDYVRASIRAAQDTPLREVMTPCDICVGLTDSLQQCLSLMAEHRLRYLPVRDGRNLIALLSLDECLKATVAYLERVFKENELDRQIVSLQGTYSC